MPANPLLRRGYTLALHTFRSLPAPVRRTLVRTGTPSFTVGAVAAIEHDGRLLFLSQPHRGGWSLPGGLLNRGEQPDAGVIREVREETGLHIEVDLPLTCLVNSRVRRVDVIYLVPLTSRPEVRVGGEALDYAWLSPDDVPEADDSTSEIIGALARARRRPDSSGHCFESDQP